jgi:hypothetical protein
MINNIIPKALSQSQTESSFHKVFITYRHVPENIPITKYDVKLSNTYKNILSIGLETFAFPSTSTIYNISKYLNNNILHFRLSTPLYAYDVSNNYIKLIVNEILLENSDKLYTIELDDGTYSSIDLANALTRLLNTAVSELVATELSGSSDSNDLILFVESGEYTGFKVVFDEIEDRFFFGNCQSSFVLMNKHTSDKYFFFVNKEKDILSTFMGMEKLNIESDQNSSGDWNFIKAKNRSLIDQIDLLFMFVEQLNFIDISSNDTELNKYRNYFAPIYLKESRKTNYHGRCNTNLLSVVQNNTNANIASFTVCFKDKFGRIVDFSDMYFDFTLALNIQP